MNAIWFKGCYSVTSAERTLLMRQEASSRRNIKTSFPNRCSDISFVDSIEGWSKKQDKTSKETSDHQTKSGRSKRSYISHREDHQASVTSCILRNRTEDKRAFRRMLTSADQLETTTIPVQDRAVPEIFIFVLYWFRHSSLICSNLSHPG